MLTIFVTRLRRAVLHPSLVLDTKEDEQRSTENIDVNDLIKQFAGNEATAQNGPNESYAQNVVDGLQEDEECPICFYVMEEPMIIQSCLHKRCVRSYGSNCALIFIDDPVAVRTVF